MDAALRTQDICASLVREFLYRKGLSSTLKCMEREMPRHPNSINSRTTLCHALGLESSYKKNKARKEPFRTLIEVIVHRLSKKSKHYQELFPDVDLVPETNVDTQKEAGEEGKNDLTLSQLSKLHRNLEKRGRKIDFYKLVRINCGCLYKLECPHSHDNLDLEDMGGGGEGARVNREGEGSVPVEEPLTEAEEEGASDIRVEQGCQTGEAEDEDVIVILGKEPLSLNQTWVLTDEGGSLSEGRSQGLVRNEQGEPTVEEENSYYYQKDPKLYREKHPSPLREKEHVLLSSLTLAEQGNTPPTLVENNNSPTQMENKNNTHLEGDEESPGGKKPHEFRQMSSELSGRLRKLLIGNASLFPQQWIGQSFVFTNNPKMRYGFIQSKGGCCGIFAPVQAFLLKALLFDDDTKENVEPLRPSQSEVQTAFVKALTDILWQAGQNQAVLALVSKELLKPWTSFDCLMETIKYKTFTSKSELSEAIDDNLIIFTLNGSSGCLLLLISAILSRGIQSVLEDMDDDTCCFIGDNGFCSLEVVNLLLTGCAVSNVFDNNLEIDSCTLRGISKRADIGFLSLYEHYNSCQVGANFKTPRNPIWVVNSENHFTVLFSCQKDLVSDWKVERKFNLYHYDGMQAISDILKLVIDTTGHHDSANAPTNAPPLEHCIRTKWKDAVILWVGNQTQ